MKKTCSAIKVICLALILSLVLGNFSVFALTNNSETIITEELKKKLSSLDSNDMIPVYIWLTDIDHIKIDRLVEKKIGISKKDFIIKNKNLKSVNEFIVIKKDDNLMNNKFKSYMDSTEKVRQAKLEKSQLFIQEKRIKSKDIYNSNNRGFINSKLKGENIIFQSQYTPMIIANLPKNKIIALTKNSKVKLLDLYVEPKIEEELNMSLSSIKADYAKSTLGLTGKNVKIGQIEPGSPDTNNSSLKNQDITNIGSAPTSSHSTLVASIMVGSQGVAPDAKLYSISSDDFYSGVETLISNGVQVINMSAGIDNGGKYSIMDQWVDHISNQHNVTFVKSAGNNSGGYGTRSSNVTSPGLAYNAITVGSINDKNTSSMTDDSISAYSSYKEASTAPSKPDLMAPGENITGGGQTNSGTSFAAPHVAGVAAQLIEFEPSLATNPRLMKAVLMAGCTRKVSGESLSSITNKEGSGIINVQNSHYVLNGSRYSTATISGSTFTKNIQVTSNDTFINIALVWDKQNTLMDHSSDSNISNPKLGDLDLKVYDPSGKLVASSESGYNSAEFVHFTVSQTGTYRIEVIPYDNNSTVRFALAWY